MITYYSRKPSAPALSVVDRYQPGAWVSVENPTSDDIDQLVEKFDLDAGHMDDALDGDELPRLEREGDVAYIFVRYAYSNEHHELTTAPLLCVVGPELLVTVAYGELPRREELLGGKLKFVTSEPLTAVLALLDQIVDQYEIRINEISHQIKRIRVRLRSHEIANQDFIDFVQIEDELNEFLSALLPMTAIMRRLMLGRHLRLTATEHDAVEDLLLNNEQSIEGCQSSIKSIVNIRHAYSTISSNNLNRSMRILTGATVLIALPNLFYGMYGMNVNLPFQEEVWTYFAVLFTTILVTVVVFVYARRKRIF